MRLQSVDSTALFRISFNGIAIFVLAKEHVTNVRQGEKENRKVTSVSSGSARASQIPNWPCLSKVLLAAYKEDRDD